MYDNKISPQSAMTGHAGKSAELLRSGHRSKSMEEA
jgi:hypothetical protein